MQTLRNSTLNQRRCRLLISRQMQCSPIYFFLFCLCQTLILIKTGRQLSPHCTTAFFCHLKHFFTVSLIFITATATTVRVRPICLPPLLLQKLFRWLDLSLSVCFFYKLGKTLNLTMLKQPCRFVFCGGVRTTENGSFLFFCWMQ